VIPHVYTGLIDRKGSLLTRIMGGKDSDESDDDSAENLKRTEGLDAQAFSAPLGTGVAPAPPKYIRVYFPAKTRLIFRSGRTIKSKKILITFSLPKNSSVPPTSATENPLPRQKPPPRMEILLLIPQPRTPFHVTKPARYGR
jgi:hypothetical protein